MTLTFVGLMTGAEPVEEDGRRGTDPVAARIRPQLECNKFS